MAHVHQPRKRFGQHFLHDPMVIQRIVAAIRPRPTDNLLEIGPGKGAITRPVLEQAGRMQVVEIDRDLIPILERDLANVGALILHREDALRFDYCAHAGDQPLRVIGNLPYNISTPLLFHLLKQMHCIQDMHFMLQKEVVDRMAAGPGDEAYGRLSVMVQYHCQVENLFDIGRGAFTPPPRVISSLVRLIPHAQPPVEVHNPAHFRQLVTQAFSHRRKTLRNALSGLLAEDAIRGCDIDAGLRPEALGLVEYACLANRYTRMQEAD